MNNSDFNEGYFKAHDGLRLYYRTQPFEGASDLVVIIHGHGEHIGRYEKFFKILSSEGYSVAAFDLRGCGRSEGPEAYVENFDLFLKDLTSFLAFLQGEFKNRGKLILFGHSLGGLIAFHWALANQGLIKGLVLSSPCFGLRLPPVLVSLIRFLNRICPKFYFKKPVYPVHLSHNLEEIKRYEKDPLIRRKISVRLLEQMLTYSNKLNAGQRYLLSMPVFMILSGMEKVVDLEKTLSLYDQIESPKKDKIVFEGFYHEVFNELGQDKAFEVLKRYLKQI